jgi:hypothetical protein
MIGLAEGLHAVTLRYFQRGGESELALEAALEGSGESIGVGDRLFHH